MVEPKLKRLNQNELVQPKYSKILNILEADNSNSYKTNGNEAFQCCHAPGIVNLAFLHKVSSCQREEWEHVWHDPENVLSVLLICVDRMWCHGCTQIGTPESPHRDSPLTEKQKNNKNPATESCYI